MSGTLTPESYALKISKTIQHAFGLDAYPLNLTDVIMTFSPVYAPKISLECKMENLKSIEGALIPSSNKTKYTIIVNENIDSEARKNFTLAHEFGHFLCHREFQESFKCGADDVGGAQNDIEGEANLFASRLLLPPNLVRQVADADPFDFAAVAALATKTGASITASALACIEMSSRPIGFAVVRDGFVRWGRASDDAYQAGLFFKSGREVPEGSISNFEDGVSTGPLPSANDNGEWVEGFKARESGFYSERYAESYLCIDLR